MWTQPLSYSTHFPSNSRKPGVLRSSGRRIAAIIEDIRPQTPQKRHAANEEQYHHQQAWEIEQGAHVPLYVCTTELHERLPYFGSFLTLESLGEECQEG